MQFTWTVQKMFLDITEAVGFERPAEAAPATQQRAPVVEHAVEACQPRTLPFCIKVTSPSNATKSNFRYGQIFADLLFVYFNGLEWPRNPGCGQLKVTFLELMLDAVASSRMWLPWGADGKSRWPKWPHVAASQIQGQVSYAVGAHLGPPPLRQQPRVFADAARALGQLYGDMLWEGREMQGRPGYLNLGSRQGLSVRPRLRCPSLVFRWLQQLERQSKGPKQQSALDCKVPLALPDVALLDLASVPERQAAARLRVARGGAEEIPLETRTRFSNDPAEVAERQEAERVVARRMHAEGQPLHVVQNLGDNKYRCEVCGWTATGNRCKFVKRVCYPGSEQRGNAGVRRCPAAAAASGSGRR